MAQNLIETIAQKFAVDAQSRIHAGDYITIRPEHILTHDNTGAVIPKFKSIGAKKIMNPRQTVFVLDHNVQDKSDANLDKYAKIQAFAHEMGVDFYPAGRGIGHQIMCEEGYAFPGTMVVASDSHSNMYGGLGCLGTPIVRTDAAAIWASGQTWWQVPPVAKVNLINKLRPGCSGKDIILTLCGIYNNDEVLNHAIEFSGDGIQYLSIEQRLTIANMTTEWGALAGVFPVDDVCLDWVQTRIDIMNHQALSPVPSHKDMQEHPRLNPERLALLKAHIPQADTDAFYAKEITLDLSKIEAVYTGPHNVKTLRSFSNSNEAIKINKAYLLSCVNSRVGDLAEAAKVVKGKKIAGHVDFYIAAASQEVMEQSKALGDWDTLLESGAKELPPGCGPCIGLGAGLLEENEVGISATNRNFKGRMGAKSAEAYLASPAVVAASALSGYISAADNRVDHLRFIKTMRENKQSVKSTKAADILPGFPEKIMGEVIFCPQDNLNTDGIYPGKYTYVDDFTAEQQAQVVMENYDPEFVKIASSGDILVGGINFGTGSSREQAATALKHKGIALVIAGSFSETYKRNAFNNGFLVLESAELVKVLRSNYGEETLTVRTEMKIVIDFMNATIHFDDIYYHFSPIGHAAQEMIVSKGLENWVRQKLELE